MLVKSRANACFEHSDFLKVTSPTEDRQTIKPNETRRQKRRRNPVSHEMNRIPTPEVQLRAFQPQQFTYTLLELELPQMLAPDLPSNCSLQMGLSTAHCNYQTLRARYCYILSLPLPSRNWVICAPAAFLRCGSREIHFACR